ncbi:unnamed protein product [Lupinus luteus]|uniref:Uncharacterized protein n=1 Tax=Lupinus luteus TaxID=3873 RepID=A0AAV1VSD2_LUPLU
MAEISRHMIQQSVISSYVSFGLIAKSPILDPNLTLECWATDHGVFRECKVALQASKNKNGLSFASFSDLLLLSNGFDFLNRLMNICFGDYQYGK